MKLITALILLAVFGVVGCTNGRMVLKKHDPQLTYRCDMDPYRPECVNKQADSLPNDCKVSDAAPRWLC